jgi:TonB family protein
MPPSKNQEYPASPDLGRGVQRASSVEPENTLELSPEVAEGSLLHRVEPEYPEQALQQKVQGAVVLDIHIGADGAVQDLRVVSGPPELAEASRDAVRQWRFEPHTVNGRAVEILTRVTLNFRLPD